MEDVIVVASVVGLLAFLAGCSFSKYVVSEAASIKAHVTEEVSALRAEVAAVLGNAAKKVG